MIQPFAKEYQRLIDELDKTLAMLRGFWMAAKSPKEKAEVFKKIDAALDDRLRYMKLRDGVAA
jgi:hypothetical protein